MAAISTRTRHLQFSRGPHGKPVLATERGADALCFNIAHSHDVALCAVARGRDIGVDVERVREDVDVDLIAERFFSQREIAALQLLPPETRLKAFFTCWVRKEAYVKARGDGLAMGLDSFGVSFLPGEPPALLDVEGHPEEALAWSLRELDVAPSFAAALAVRAGEFRVKRWEFTATSGCSSIQEVRFDCRSSEFVVNRQRSRSTNLRSAMVSTVLAYALVAAGCGSTPVQFL